MNEVSPSTPHVGRSADGPLLTLLAKLADRLPIAVLDELWLFPPHRLGTTESAVVVVSAREQSDEQQKGPDHATRSRQAPDAGIQRTPVTTPPARQRVITARYRLAKDDRGRATIAYEITEHGLAPADRIHKLVAGVLGRLDPDLAARPPRTERVGGDPTRWQALLDAVAEDSVPR